MRSVHQVMSFQSQKKIKFNAWRKISSTSSAPGCAGFHKHAEAFCHNMCGDEMRWLKSLFLVHLQLICEFSFSHCLFNNLFYISSFLANFFSFHFFSMVQFCWNLFVLIFILGEEMQIRYFCLWVFYKLLKMYLIYNQLLFDLLDQEILLTLVNHPNENEFFSRQLLLDE